jgi:pimeloyl-ACP methyl ester carboxylesterase
MKSRLLALLCVAGCLSAQAQTVVTEEFTVPALDAGISLYVRNKHLEGESRFPADKVLLYVHGSTYPAETTFDFAVNGFSWMDYIARRGYDVYLLDVRGYGRSTRPHEMNAPPKRNPPLVTTATAVKDVAAAVDFIRQRRSVDRINLVGWSWGTTLVGWYTADNNSKVNKLVLYAPQWISRHPVAPKENVQGAYRIVTRGAVKRSWLHGVPAARRPALIPEDWFEAWADATFATDPWGARQLPPVLRAPNGTKQDARFYWMAGKPMYDPGSIRVPTLLVHAEWDAELPSYMLNAYLARLTHAPYKRYVEIGEGTHFVMMEKNRLQLFGVVQQFLEEDFKPMP